MTCSARWALPMAALMPLISPRKFSLMMRPAGSSEPRLMRKPVESFSRVPESMRLFIEFTRCAIIDGTFELIRLMSYSSVIRLVGGCLLRVGAEWPGSTRFGLVRALTGSSDRSSWNSRRLQRPCNVSGSLISRRLQIGARRRSLHDLCRWRTRSPFTSLRNSHDRYGWYRPHRLHRRNSVPAGAIMSPRYEQQTAQAEAWAV